MNSDTVNNSGQVSVSPKNPPNRAEKRVVRTKKKLLAAALEVFSESGVDAATIEEITQRADLGKGTFYRHFSDKAEVMASLVENAIDKLIGKLQDKDDSRSLEEVLEHIINVHYRFFRDNTEEFILLFQGRLFLKLDRQITEHMEGPFSRYLELIEDLISPFLSEKVDILRIRRFACAVAGFVFGFFSFMMIGMGSEEIETGIKPLRQSFVKSLTTFLVQ
jgi:AcrR family transcriptional regulator